MVVITIVVSVGKLSMNPSPKKNSYYLYDSTYEPASKTDTYLYDFFKILEVSERPDGYTIHHYSYHEKRKGEWLVTFSFWKKYVKEIDYETLVALLL